MRMHAKKHPIVLLALCPLVALAQDPAAPPPADPVAQFEAVLRETHGLTIYNELLERQIAAQQVDVQNLQAAIESVPDLERQLPPLLITMVEGLADFVEADIPFLVEQERRQRVEDLQILVERSEISSAEKLRRILEAWSIEVEYGGAFQAYRGELSIDGTAREVDFLQLGRIGLIYQTTDEEAITGAWDMRNNTWVPLGAEHRNSVRQALRMARNQNAPDLVLLPVIPPQQD